MFPAEETKPHSHSHNGKKHTHLHVRKAG